MSGEGTYVGLRNCHFRDGLAYTKENRLIYNILFFNVPDVLPIHYMQNYFEHFGDLLNIGFVRSKNRLQMGFVKFAAAKSAAEVLNKVTHFLPYACFGVKALKTRYQPEDKNAIENVGKTTVSPTVTATTTLSILDLNDDCLVEIFRNLTFAEKVRFALTCRRMFSIMKVYGQKEINILNLSKLADLTMWELSEFLRCYGSQIEEIMTEEHFRNMRDILNVMLYHKNCNNLKIINFQIFNQIKINLTKICQNWKNITTIILHECRLDDAKIAVFENLPNLTKLDLCGNVELSGQYIYNFRTVEILDLSNCISILPIHMVEILKSLENLKSLNIKNCHKLSQETFTAMERNCHKLETLIFTKVDCHYEYIARMPKLKHLEILASVFLRTSTMRQELFDELVAHKQNQLEILHISVGDALDAKRAKQLALFTNLKRLSLYENAFWDVKCFKEFCKLKKLEEIYLCNCLMVKDEHALAILRQCTHLKKMVLHGCECITNEFIFGAIEILKERQDNNGGEHQEIVEVKVSDTNIQRQELENHAELLAASRNLLKINYNWLYEANNEYCYDFDYDYDYNFYDNYDDSDSSESDDELYEIF